MLTLAAAAAAMSRGSATMTRPATRWLFSRRGIPLRRRSSDFSVYVVTTFVGIAGGVYIFLEPLRQLRMQQQPPTED